MKKSDIKKAVITLLEMILLIILIVVIIYLVKSENGLLGKMSQKTANEKIDTIIKEFMESEDGGDFEDYLRKIDGLEEIKVNRKEGTVELKVNGKDFVIVVDSGNTEEKLDELEGNINNE